MKIEIELPEIEGFEYTGEYTMPKVGEYYLDIHFKPFERVSINSNDPFPILRKLKPKRVFKDGAFYQVAMVAGLIQNARDIAQYKSSSQTFHTFIHDNPHTTSGDYKEVHFCWIGAELIEWGEG